MFQEFRKATKLKLTLPVVLLIWIVFPIAYATEAETNATESAPEKVICPTFQYIDSQKTPKVIVNWEELYYKSPYDYKDDGSKFSTYPLKRSKCSFEYHGEDETQIKNVIYVEGIYSGDIIWKPFGSAASYCSEFVTFMFDTGEKYGKNATKICDFGRRDLGTEISSSALWTYEGGKISFSNDLPLKRITDHENFFIVFKLKTKDHCSLRVQKYSSSVCKYDVNPDYYCRSFECSKEHKLWNGLKASKQEREEHADPHSKDRLTINKSNFILIFLVMTFISVSLLLCSVITSPNKKDIPTLYTIRGTHLINSSQRENAIVNGQNTLTDIQRNSCLPATSTDIFTLSQHCYGPHNISREIANSGRRNDQFATATPYGTMGALSQTILSERINTSRTNAFDANAIVSEGNFVSPNCSKGNTFESIGETKLPSPPPYDKCVLRLPTYLEAVQSQSMSRSRPN